VTESQPVTYLLNNWAATRVQRANKNFHVAFHYCFVL